MRRRTCRGTFPILALLAVAGPAFAQDAAQPAAQKPVPVPVLDTYGVWRFHQTLRPPVLAMGEGLEPELVGMKPLNEPTAPPDEGWRSADFDDGSWVQAPALAPAKTPYLAELCLRGKFRVTDPSKVSGLVLSLAYHGGAVVYLNGTEIARGHLPAGGKGAERPAEAYPIEAFAAKDGKLITAQLYDRGISNQERQAVNAARRRTLSDVVLPAKLLRKGVNVLAVDIVRAPYHKVVAEQKIVEGDRSRREFAWFTCDLLDIRLTASEAAGLVPNAVRPEGFHVWNRDLLAADYDLDFGDPKEPLRPVALVGARNGCYSGKLLVGSTQPIRGLRATATDLKSSDGATIPASAVHVRYGILWGYEHPCTPYGIMPSPYPAGPSLLGALADAPPAEIPVAEKAVSKYARGDPTIVPGASASVWVTVKVPRDAKPGTYAGQLRIEAEGEEAVAAAIQLEVLPWTLPDPGDWRTWVEMIQSPDTLAVEYELPLWSERHWQMIARSMDLIGDAGSRVVYVPLIAQTNQGNAASMVRWIRKPDGTHDYDFSIMERYLDTAEQHMGRPRIVVFNVWEVYLIDKNRYASARGQEANAIRYLEKANALAETGPWVTVVDPANGKTENVCLPSYEQPASRALWAPLFTELRRRMEKRGLAGAMMLGTMSDAHATKAEAAFFKDLSGDMPWVSHAHHGAPTRLARFGYSTQVWNIHFANGDPVGDRPYGWKRDYLLADYERHGSINYFKSTKWRHYGEMNITGGQRGIGRIGADFWGVLRDKKGNRAGTVAARYPQSSRRNLDLHASVLAPGPDGPVATTHYEVFREGVQECEARIAIERALTDDALRAKLGDDLAARCQAALDERAIAMWQGLSSLELTGPGWHYLTWRGWPAVAAHTWFMGSGWQERSRKLYRLAGEVESKVK